MSNGFFHLPHVVNEQVLTYLPGSEERENLKSAIDKARSEVIDIPMYIGGREIRTKEKVPIYPPHDIQHLIGYYSKAEKMHVEQAIDAALNAAQSWASFKWYDRASIFLKAAELLSGPYRAKMNAATMLGQSKTIHQAEIDSACELIDFFRFNVEFMSEIYKIQPQSSKGIWNRIEWRPLEGFIFALTPFNFTSIAGNLPTAPAIMGNVVVWKPSKTQIYSARLIMEILMEAGLPDGVINLIYPSGPDAGEVVLKHPYFAGLHFTGSTRVFSNLWKVIGENIPIYKTYPRIVGETGGKDFVMVHSSADPKQVAVALTRGAFEYQGQKCSAASRAYIPENLWNQIQTFLINDLQSIKIGSPEIFENFFNSVIDEAAFDKIVGYIEKAKADDSAKIIYGGTYSKTKGYFIDPTVIVTTDPAFVTMREEIFGPVLTIYVYKENQYSKMLDIVDSTSNYALTGAIFAKDRKAIDEACEKLVNAAGNFYINDKPTGAVVNQQPFGGARASGTNDKAGSVVNLLRWVSPRSIKENFNPPIDYQYPFLKKE